jgi:hypothetical protein
VIYLLEEIDADPKILEAGRLAKAKGGRYYILGVFVAAIGYCRRYKTDGHLPRSFFLDKDKAGSVAPSLRAGLIQKTKTGDYVIPSYLRYNRSAAQVQQTLQLQRERMAKLRRHNQGAAGRDTSGGDADVRAHPTAGDADVRNGDANVRVPTIHDPRSTKNRGTPANQHDLPVLSTSSDRAASKREQRTRTSAHSPPVENLTKEGKNRLAKVPAADGNFAVLVCLTHDVLDELGSGTPRPSDPDLLEAVKLAAAKWHIAYDQGDTLTRAVTAAVKQRLGGKSAPLPALARGRC